jgi:hypothetical protein
MFTERGELPTKQMNPNESVMTATSRRPDTSNRKSPHQDNRGANMGEARKRLDNVDFDK